MFAREGARVLLGDILDDEGSPTSNAPGLSRKWKALSSIAIKPILEVVTTKGGSGVVLSTIQRLSLR